MFDEGRIQEVCTDCFVQECERKKNRLLGRGKALRDKPNRDFDALPDGEARDAAVETFLNGLDGAGGFAEQAEALAGELDEFASGNCPRRHRRQAEREANRLRRQANAQRKIAKHYRGIRQANRMARNLRKGGVGSPNFWRTMGHLGRLR